MNFGNGVEFDTERELCWRILDYIRYDYYKTRRGFAVFPGLLGIDEQHFIAICEQLRMSGVIYLDYSEENIRIYKPVEPFRMWI